MFLAIKLLHREAHVCHVSEVVCTKTSLYRILAKITLKITYNMFFLVDEEKLQDLDPECVSSNINIKCMYLTVDGVFG